MSEMQGRKKDKNQHIQVFARVRPPNQAELYGKSPTVVEVTSTRECIVRERPHDKHTKKFTFDRVFGPSSKQLDVYNVVVSPLVDEVLAGYNCTVFAYGQTGTGKTYTMEGLSIDPAIPWQSDTSAGIIPRALSHLFDELKMMESQEYTVRVSFLELYNEELFDLLSPNDDASKIRLYEDSTKKGAVIINGLEEVTVHNISEVYKILEKGSEKRQTAATLMNAHSSRSHTVFSITVHIKENTVEGEELLKTGKLNLVDLAGSENVGRSGAVDRRAREAGNINQSLLTLGRVITALVERAPHIPYRESKLTRLLQESLGGRTKTSIIATISPASVNLEETLSTLDYAHRAKNITNRPEINQKLSKKALLKEYTDEIERLRRDLQAARERNGVYLAQDNYNEIQATIEFQGKEIEEKINHIKALEEAMATKEKLLDELNIDLETTKQQVEITKQERDEQIYLVENHVRTEKVLTQQAKELLTVADIASTDVNKLHDKIERKCDVEMKNEKTADKFKNNIAKRCDKIDGDLSNSIEELINFFSSSKDKLLEQTTNNSIFFTNSIQSLSYDLIKEQKCIIDNLTNNSKLSYTNYETWFENEVNNARTLTSLEREALKKLAIDFAPKISKLVDNKICENLRIINAEQTMNIINLRDNIKTKIQDLIVRFVSERNLMNKEMDSVLEKFETSIRLMEESKIEEEEFRKINENYSRELNQWYDRQNQRQTQVIESSQFGISKWKNINSQLDKILINQQETKSLVSDYSYKSLTDINDKLSQQLEENCKLSERAIAEGEIINNELHTEIDRNCELLSCYKSEMESNIIKYKDEIKCDRDKMLLLIDNNCKIITHASKCHEENMSNHCKILENNFTQMHDEFDKQTSNSNKWKDTISMQLHEMINQSEEFYSNELKRDIPTGLTPCKRDFSYPRQLAATSPHERILKRYRQHQHQLTPITINNDNENLSINTDNIIMKSASASDISQIIDNNNATKPMSIKLISKSQSELFNKENDEYGGENDDGFVKPALRQPKLLVKTRSGNCINKRILSSRND